ncbi:MAG: DUF1829 domain-containing protein [Anaerolineae bacterium]|nr:DUF1829 domain-containing protein [Anaerolineae bacterium]
MINDIERRLDEYLVWLRDKTAVKQIDDHWVEITTPFLDRHNDYLQIYARRENGSYLLTDDGYIIDDLEQSGCNLDTPKRQAILRITLANLGVQVREGRLEVQASPQEFGKRKHDLVQAMLAVNDMFSLASPTVESLFYEDVQNWLDLHDIRYTPQIRLTGQTGYNHRFDFIIPKSRNYPERIVQTINKPGRDTSESLAFAWYDTRDARPANSSAYAILNDQEHGVAYSVTSALESYGIKPILWSERESATSELAA